MFVVRLLMIADFTKTERSITIGFLCYSLVSQVAAATLSQFPPNFELNDCVTQNHYSIILHLHKSPLHRLVNDGRRSIDRPC